MGYPNPFAGGDQWNDVERPAKYNDGTPHGQPNPFQMGTNPETGEPGYGVPVASPGVLALTRY
jgi:hypothetical protein